MCVPALRLFDGNGDLDGAPVSIALDVDELPVLHGFPDGVREFFKDVRAVLSADVPVELRQEVVELVPAFVVLVRVDVVDSDFELLVQAPAVDARRLEHVVQVGLDDVLVFSVPGLLVQHNDVDVGLVAGCFTVAVGLLDLHGRQDFAGLHAVGIVGFADEDVVAVFDFGPVFGSGILAGVVEGHGVLPVLVLEEHHTDDVFGGVLAFGALKGELNRGRRGEIDGNLGFVAIAVQVLVHIGFPDVVNGIHDLFLQHGFLLLFLLFTQKPARLLRGAILSCMQDEDRRIL